MNEMIIVEWVIRLSGLVGLFFFLGAPYIPRNRIGGIRFPYTLSDDEVWKEVHLKSRGWFLIMAVLCFFFPLNTTKNLLSFTAVFLIFLILFVFASYRTAKKSYLKKFGTDKVVSKGFFQYGPPSEETSAPEETKTGEIQT